MDDSLTLPHPLPPAMHDPNCMYFSGDTFAHYSFCMCSSDSSVSHGGIDVTTHVRGKHHKDMAKAMRCRLKY